MQWPERVVLTFVGHILSMLKVFPAVSKHKDFYLSMFELHSIPFLEPALPDPLKCTFVSTMAAFTEGSGQIASTKKLVFRLYAHVSTSLETSFGLSQKHISKLKIFQNLQNWTFELGIPFWYTIPAHVWSIV